MGSCQSKAQQKSKDSLGKRGEKIAERFLKKKGYRIVERNFRCPFGEIDLIAWDGDTLAFIEVKTRSDKSFGPAEMSVDLRKQRHLSKASLAYMGKKNFNNLAVRFDVVTVIVSPEENETTLIKNAFDLVI